MNEPLVSVILSVYNGEKYVGRALESILNQTFTDFELIVVNDGSTDGTDRILGQLDDPRVVLVSQENKGLIASLNRGCSLAKGKYLARQDADDISMPERLAKQVAFMEAHPDVGLLGTAYHQLDEDGKELLTVTWPTEDSSLRRVLIRYSPFCHGSVMMRRTVFEECGGYEPGLVHVEDYGLWFEFSYRAKIANLSEVLYEWRSHPANISMVWERQQSRASLGIRARAIVAKKYSKINYAYLLRNWIAMKLPSGPRRLVLNILRSGRFIKG